jgi:hypothetical protein
VDSQSTPDKSSGPIDALKKCYYEEYLLIGDLREVLNQTYTEQTHRSLLSILDRLLENLPRQMALPHENAYLSVVLERCPNSHGKIEALRQANQECISELDGLRNRVDDKSNSTVIDEELGCRLIGWMETLVTIRTRESRLLQEAFTIDIGGES